MFVYVFIFPGGSWLVKACFHGLLSCYHISKYFNIIWCFSDIFVLTTDHLIIVSPVYRT